MRNNPKGTSQNRDTGGDALAFPKQPGERENNSLTPSAEAKKPTTAPAANLHDSPLDALNADSLQVRSARMEFKVLGQSPIQIGETSIVIEKVGIPHG